MKCERFWDEADEFIPLGPNRLPEALRSHLDACPRCRKEFELLFKGMDALNRQIHRQESEAFWHTMKKEVREQVRVPSRRLWSGFEFFGPWGLAWSAAALVIFVFALKVFSPSAPSLTGRDLIALFGSDPMVCLYDEGLSDSLEQEQEEPDPYIYAGLADSWTALMVETASGQTENNGTGKYRRKDHEKDVSGNFHDCSGFTV